MHDLFKSYLNSNDIQNGANVLAKWEPSAAEAKAKEDACRVAILKYELEIYEGRRLPILKPQECTTGVTISLAKHPYILHQHLKFEIIDVTKFSSDIDSWNNFIDNSTSVIITLLVTRQNNSFRLSLYYGNKQEHILSHINPQLNVQLTFHEHSCTILITNTYPISIFHGTWTQTKIAQFDVKRFAYNYFWNNGWVQLVDE